MKSWVDDFIEVNGMDIDTLTKSDVRQLVMQAFALGYGTCEHDIDLKNQRERDEDDS